MTSCSLVSKTGPKVPMVIMLYIISRKTTKTIIQQNKSKMVILWIGSLNRVHIISNVLLDES